MAPTPGLGVGEFRSHQHRVGLGNSIKKKCGGNRDCPKWDVFLLFIIIRLDQIASQINPVKKAKVYRVKKTALYTVKKPKVYTL